MNMFALPEAKRIRREDLARSEDWEWSDDGEMDAELQARLNAQIAKSLGLEQDEGCYTTSARAATSQSRDQGQSLTFEPEPAESGDEGGYSFRLFSTAGPTPKIVLEDPNRDQGEGAIVRNRPLSYFLAGKPTAELKWQYDFAAVTGDEVLSRSRVRSWGLELPWKVTTIKVVRNAKTGDVSAQSDGMDTTSATKRKRPGKKRRIAMRTKERAKAQAKEAAKKKEVDKEEHLKEKKKRMNRLKKLRKRAKKKEGKECDAGVDQGGDDDDDDSSGDD